MQADNLYSVFGVMATILSVVAFVPYVRSILKNKTRPSGASWWTWSLLSLVTVVSARAGGASWPVLLLPIWYCFSNLSIALFSVKKGDNNWDILNKLCIAGSLVGVLLWFLTGKAFIALTLTIIADFFASIPNFRHVLKDPFQENWLGWGLGWGAAILEIFAVRNWSLAEAGYPTYLLINLTVVLFFLSIPRIKKFL